MILLPPGIRWPLSGTLPSLGARRLDWSWTFSNVYHYFKDRGGALSASVPEIGLNWPQFGALVPFLIPLLPGIRWRLSGTLPSLGARCLDWSWTFSNVYHDVRERRGALCASAPEISVYWPQLGILIPFLIPQPPGIRWCLRWTLPRLVARCTR